MCSKNIIELLVAQTYLKKQRSRLSLVSVAFKTTLALNMGVLVGSILRGYIDNGSLFVSSVLIAVSVLFLLLVEVDMRSLNKELNNVTEELKKKGY